MITQTHSVGTTNTYAIHRDRFGPEFPSKIEDLWTSACKILVDAKGPEKNNKSIAASIGPLGGSYRTVIYESHKKAVELFQEKAAHLEPYVDMFLCETVSSITHLKAVLEGVRNVAKGKPVFLCVTVDDTNGKLLRSGEQLREALKAAKGKCDAILINCSAPEAIPSGLSILKESGLPFGAYANGFTHICSDFLKKGATVDCLKARKDLSPETYAKHVVSWTRDYGATIVGGCCETGPSHIKATAELLRASNYEIVDLNGFTKVEKEDNISK